MTLVNPYISFQPAGGLTIGAVDLTATTSTQQAWTWGNPGVMGSDGDQMSLVFWYKIDTLPSVTGHDYTLYDSQNGDFASNWSLFIDNADDKIKFGELDGTWRQQSVFAISADSQWHCLMVSTDNDVAGAGTSAMSTMYLDGTDIQAVSPSYRSSNGDRTRPTGIGSRDAGNSQEKPFKGYLALAWIDTVYRDFSILANRDKFYEAGKFVDVGSDGSTPFGAPPRVCMKGNSTTFGTNVGAGSNPANAPEFIVSDAAGPVAA